MFELPVIDAQIRDIAPGFIAMSIHVDATNARAGQLPGNLLEEASGYVVRGGPSWAEAHLTSWADAYQRFGAKPNRTPCSAQALRKRVLKDGKLPPINPLVDLYNAVSLK
ncbi:B3/4 domain-containing protein [Mycoplana dimorpha]|uniref:B3/4 domain-containing protein n=1 Tax=Mycoplana dimorpha TaxID=28320 RepID=A0A2T5AM24_MYCDI|nr:B3/4 domain-containing protein [Mycoplana dimorpha]